jgi:hypothetical protein
VRRELGGTDQFIDREKFYESFPAWLGVRVVGGRICCDFDLPGVRARLEEVVGV